MDVFELVERYGLATVLVILAVIGIWKGLWPFLVGRWERWEARQDEEQARRLERQDRQAETLLEISTAMHQVNQSLVAAQEERREQSEQLKEAFDETNKGLRGVTEALTMQLTYLRQFNEDILAMRRQQRK